MTRKFDKVEIEIITISNNDVIATCNLLDGIFGNKKDSDVTFDNVL